MDRYEEALEKARVEYEKARKQGYAWLMNLLEGMFPELRDSEDERIRKAIMEVLKRVSGATDVLENQGTTFKKAMIWLEKKEEQTEELPIRLNGVMQEYVKAGKDDEEQEHRLKCYQLFWDALGDSEFFKQKEQKFTERQDYSDLTDLERAIHRGFLVVGVENVPVTIIKETAQDCLAQMKPAGWSEEDEYKLNFLIEMLEGLDQREFNIRYMKELSSWLKSLRPQPHWKPSEAQMRYLLAVINDPNNIGSESCYMTIKSLYNDLKKL